VIAHQAGRHDLAVEWIGQAILLNPNNSGAYSNLGEACRAIGRLDEAIAAYRRALDLNPKFAEAHVNLGNTLRARGRIDEAIAAYRCAIEIKPDDADAHTAIGEACRTMGRLEEALAAYRRALELKPDCAEFHLNVGVALAEQKQFEEAITAYHRALELKPDYVEAHNNLGAALARLGQLDESVAAYSRVLELKCDFAGAHNNLGAALAGQGRIEEAIAAYRRALELKPDNAWVHSNLIYTLHFHSGDDGSEIDVERQRWNRRFCDPLKSLIRPHANARRSDRPLRIGYVSPAFLDDVVGRNLLPLFRRHDRRQFEVLCYSGVVRPDPLTDAFRDHAQGWRSTVGVGDEALAEMIRSDGVDILVDLTQHMAGNRLPMFARQPAPVQVSFAGYPESTGLEAMGYRISDRYLEAGSKGEDNRRKEHVCLIDSFWCYDPCGVEVEVSPLPALENGMVTFGCLHSFSKINERALRLWARVLTRVTNSRLILLSGIGSQRERTLEALRKEGVARRRVEFVDFRPRREYLELYRRLDLVLDTFPYNGHTTNLDALWMGAPVVSLAGKTPVSRAGLSQLTNLGLPELVAHSEEDYVRIAVELAGDVPRLRELRSTLRARMENSVLMDALRFTRNIEAAYREMWQTWCEKRSPTREDG
jgi:protein O-GlcNAc transferase